MNTCDNMPLQPPLPPMEARLVEQIPTEEGWQYEPKWNGFRCIAFRERRTGEWEPVAPRVVVEVAYDHFTGGRFRHGTKILRWRSDKAPRQCTMDQVDHREGKSLALL
jgi:ATP-dependent DNA ligase